MSTGRPDLEKLQRVLSKGMMTPVVQYGDDTLFYYDEETNNIRTI